MDLLSKLVEVDCVFCSESPSGSSSVKILILLEPFELFFCFLKIFVQINVEVGLVQILSSGGWVDLGIVVSKRRVTGILAFHL